MVHGPRFSRLFRVYFRARDKSVRTPDLSSDILNAPVRPSCPYGREPPAAISVVRCTLPRLRQVFPSIDKIIGEPERGLTASK